MWMGDSLTRYQYLSLAIFVHRGKWPHRFSLSQVGSGKGQPSPVKERDWSCGQIMDYYKPQNNNREISIDQQLQQDTWRCFFIYGSRFMFQGSEMCDCYKKFGANGLVLVFVLCRMCFTVLVDVVVVVLHDRSVSREEEFPNFMLPGALC